jgi:hypothetical protein
MTDPRQHPTATSHARHDVALVAALAARQPDLDESHARAARDLVEHCTECRDILADLVALQVALPTIATPTRPRDFTLTPLDARRLSRRGWRAVIGFFGSARDAFSRPLAIGFTTIGMVALLVTALPSIPMGAGGGAVLSTVGNALPDEAGGAAASAAASAAPAPAAAPAASGAAVSAAPASAAASGAASAKTEQAASAPSASAAYGSADRTTALEPYATAGGSEPVFTGDDDGSGDLLTTDQTAPPSRAVESVSLGVIIAGICLVIGLGLFALRWTSRRLGGV